VWEIFFTNSAHGIKKCVHFPSIKKKKSLQFFFVKLQLFELILAVSFITVGIDTTQYALWGGCRLDFEYHVCVRARAHIGIFFVTLQKKNRSDFFFFNRRKSTHFLIPCAKLAKKNFPRSYTLLKLVIFEVKNMPLHFKNAGASEEKSNK